MFGVFAFCDWLKNGIPSIWDAKPLVAISGQNQCAI
jgi:hypothetical protein